MSALVRITPPDAEPVTLEQAKAQCRIVTADEDTLVGSFIAAARAAAEDVTGRVFMSQTWEARFDYHWPTVFNRASATAIARILLPKPPASSVTSVKYTDISGVEQTLDPAEYCFSAGAIFGFIEPAYGASWPAVRQQLETVRVRYVAGYGAEADVPEPIRQAILLTVGHFSENREAVISDLRAVAIELPLGVQSLLQPYITEGW